MPEKRPSYFLCGRQDVPGLIKRAELEAARILDDFQAFYTTEGDLDIKIEPKRHATGFSIGGRLTWDGKTIIEENDCGLLFLQLNDVIINRMLRSGFVSFGKEAV